MADNMSLFDLSVKQSSKLLPLDSQKNFRLSELTYAHPRYSLGGYRPSQTTNHTFVLNS